MDTRQCHRIPLVEIDLNMDVMHSNIDNDYKQQNEAFPDPNVDAVDIVPDLNCCPNPPIDLNSEPYLEEDDTYMEIGSHQETNSRSASKFKSKSRTTFFFSMFINILDLDKGLEFKSMESLPLSLFLLEIILFYFA